MKTINRNDVSILHDNPSKCHKIAARIRLNGKNNYLGRFSDEIETAKAYGRAAKKYHGECASLNFDSS